MRPKAEGRQKRSRPRSVRVEAWAFRRVVRCGRGIASSGAGDDDFAGGSGSGGGSGSLCGGIAAPSLCSSIGGGERPAPAPMPSSVRCARDGPASGNARDDPRMRNAIGRFMLFTRVDARGLLTREMYAKRLDARDWRTVPIEDPDGAALHQHRPGGDAAHWHGRPPRELDVRRARFPSRFRGRLVPIAKPGRG